MGERKCKWCGTALAKDRKTYCSHACRNRGEAKPHHEQPTKEGICAYCGKPFLAIRTNRKYCNSRCSEMASYRRDHPPHFRSDQSHWRLVVRPQTRERQQGICWLCGEMLGQRYDVHHALNDKNGRSEQVVALHPACHTRTHKITLCTDGVSYWFAGEALDLVRKKGLELKEYET